MNVTDEERLSRIKPSERILLLSHCLRPSQICQGKYDKQGLRCGDCTADCPINKLRREAIRLGYKGVCVAAGGHMALKFVQDNKPKGIVAVACDKELGEGIQGVKAAALVLGGLPPIVAIPLTKEGCVDTEVDEEAALRMLALGCPAVTTAR